MLKRVIMLGKNNIFQKMIFSTNGAGTTESTCKRKVDSYLTLDKNELDTKNVQAKSIKLLEENIGINFCDLGISNCFLDMALKA